MSRQVKETGRKKGMLQIALVAGIGALIGGGGSFLFFCFEEQLSSLLSGIAGNISRYSSLILILTAAITCVLSTILVLRLGKRCRKWDGEDEVWAEKLEKSIQRYQTVLGFFEILCVCISGIVLGRQQADITETIAAISAFIIAVLWTMICMDKIVKYDKNMNPEKRGNVISWNFNKQWLASCDELEKIRLFQAAYHTNITSQYLYCAIFVILVLVSAIEEVGVVPFLILAVIWCSQILLNLYYYERKPQE